MKIQILATRSAEEAPLLWEVDPLMGRFEGKYASCLVRELADKAGIRVADVRCSGRRQGSGGYSSAEFSIAGLVGQRCGSESVERRWMHFLKLASAYGAGQGLVAISGDSDREFAAAE